MAGDIKTALALSEEILEIEPGYEKIIENIDYYKKAGADKDHVISGASVKPITRNYEGDNILQHDPKEMADFRKLCREGTPFDPNSGLKCRLATYGLPHLLLKPIAYEEVLNGRQKMKVCVCVCACVCVL